MSLSSLEQYDEEFKGYQPEEREFRQIPTGKYQAVIREAEVSVSENTGADMLKLKLEIIAGSEKGFKLTRQTTFASRENVKYFMEDLAKIEVEIVPISKLDEQLDKLIGVAAEIYVKYKEYEGKMYPNVYFNSRLKIDVPPPATAKKKSAGGAMYEEVPSAGGGKGDGIPF